MTHNVLKFAICCVAMVSLSSARFAFAITLGQTDTFEDGGTDNWFGGGGIVMAASAANKLGGPAGTSDHYLLLSGGGTSGSPRLLGSNDTQWLGNFTSAGVNAVTMDLMNPGSTALSIRIAIREGTANNSPGYVSTVAYSLAANGQWNHVTFLLDSADMTSISAGNPVVTPQSFSTDIATVNDFRILDATNPAIVGDMVTGSFGVDNITAVPEPSALLFSGIALSSLAATRLRRRS